METKRSLIRADFWVQSLLGGLILLCCVSVVGIMYGLLLLMPFGAWQVLSGLVFGIGYQNRNRQIYLGLVAAYFLTLYAAMHVFEESFHDWGFALYGFFAVSLGIWYYIMTRRDYYEPVSIENYKEEINPTILDA